VQRDQQFKLANYKVIAIRSNRGYQPRVEKERCPQNKQSYSWVQEVRLVGENIEPGVLNSLKLIKLADQFELDLVEIFNAEPSL
jgi:translation initiation factor IF-3